MSDPPQPADRSTEDSLESDGRATEPAVADRAASATEPPAVDVELVALVDDATDARTVTVCPAKADATTLVTTWLTVDENALCDLDDWR